MHIVKYIYSHSFLSQATEQEWEAASAHLHGNRLYGAQCARVDGQLRGEACENRAGRAVGFRCRTCVALLTFNIAMLEHYLV